ncbi:UNVERIFIED_CONTAM: hypothetical protein K2H54_075505 [Gekko kuhli]
MSQTSKTSGASPVVRPIGIHVVRRLLTEVTFCPAGINWEQQLFLAHLITPNTLFEAASNPSLFAEQSTRETMDEFSYFIIRQLRLSLPIHSVTLGVEAAALLLYPQNET